MWIKYAFFERSGSSAKNNSQIKETKIFKMIQKPTSMENVNIIKFISNLKLRKNKYLYSLKTFFPCTQNFQMKQNKLREELYLYWIIQYSMKMKTMYFSFWNLIERPTKFLILVSVLVAFHPHQQENLKLEKRIIIKKCFIHLMELLLLLLMLL